MMGERRVAQEALCYELSLERHVPADHLLRAIERVVDLSCLRAHLRPFYSEIGRPSIDPELMIRILIIGYCFRIQSERRLCDEVHLNLAYRWFCRLGLEGDVPDHSTFSKNRHGRFRDSDLLRELFETTVRRCIAERLVGGEGFAVDASLIRADANKQRSAKGSEAFGWDDLARTRRAVRKYLDTLDKAAWGAGSPVTPKFVSRSDPAAQWTGALKGHAFFAYETNYLIDLDHTVIVDFEASRAIRQAEVGSARTMIARTQDRFGLWPGRLAADSAYGSAENLAWLVHERGIEPHIPVFDKSERRERTTFVSVLDPQVSTRGELGHIVLTVLGMVAQMERRFIKKRQREGIERAKAKGVYSGGTRRLDRDRIKALHDAGNGPAAIARAVGCSRMQVYRVLQAA